MQRRDFLGVLGGAAATWPAAVWAQSTVKVPLVGVLASLAAAPAVEIYRKKFQQLGYVPDPAARALASSRSSHVAVLIPLLTNTLFVDLLEAVHRTLLPAGYQTLIGVTHYDPHEEELSRHQRGTNSPIVRTIGSLMRFSLPGKASRVLGLPDSR